MDFSRLNTGRVLAGAIASWLLIIALLFLPWYEVDLSIEPRVESNPHYDPDTLLCGQDSSCTGWQDLPDPALAAVAGGARAAILAYIIVRGHKLSWPPGEMTMIAGFTAIVLIGYNGIIDKPGKGPGEIGISLDYGYWVALLAAIAIAIVGFTRSVESGPRKTRKAPGTV